MRAARRRPRRDGERRKAGLAEVIDLRAHRAQRLHQVADRALVHARHALHHVGAVGEREHGGERARRRARVAHVQLGALHRKARAAADPGTRRAPASRAPPGHAERGERIAHHRVSSDSSRPVSVVVPSASAASSSARLEMLFEPGSRSAPERARHLVQVGGVHGHSFG